ncbi:MAG: amidohydrolase family protein [Candidatus Binatia bacterium]
MKKKNIVIDVHHHWMPEEHYLRPELHVRQEENVVHEPDRFRIRRAGVQLFSPPKMTARIEEQIVVMDRAGVDQAALHVGVWLDWLDLKSSRLINDRMAEITAQFPDRLIPLAHVPPLEAEGLRELRRAVLKLGCKGVGINTHINGILLDDERFYPFYKTVSDLDIPVLVHPASELPLVHPHGMEQFNLTRNLGRAFDTTVNIVRLMLSGTLDRFPKLRLVFSHMGGAYFAIKNRLNPTHFDRRSRGFFDRYKQRIFIDTAPPFWSPEEIRFAVHMMGEDQVLLGSDFPTIGLLKNSVSIVQKARTSAGVKRKILGENARKLFHHR